MDFHKAYKELEDKFSMQTCYARPLPVPQIPCEPNASKGNKIPRTYIATPTTTSYPPDRSPRQKSSDRRLLEHLYGALDECAPTAAQSDCIAECKEELRALVKRVGPEWSLGIFGSLGSNFSTNTSDIDATCVRASGQTYEAPAAARFLSERILPLLPEYPRLAVSEVVLQAKVPILKLSFDGHLDIDLSCQNTHALQNTRYLRAYAEIDCRVRDLGITVKLWAKAAGVCGAANGHISSYSFTLLVIYFMQVHEEVRLPVLLADAFKDRANGDQDDLVRPSWRCGLNLEELLLRFFAFYAHDFQWGQEVASPRLGRRLSAQVPDFQQLRGRWARRLHIEDPFRLERNLHHVLGEKQEVTLRHALEEGYRCVLQGRTPPGLHCSLGRSPDAGEWLTMASEPPPPTHYPSLPTDPIMEFTVDKAAHRRTASPSTSTSSTASGGGSSTTRDEQSSFSRGSSNPGDEDLDAARPSGTELQAPGGAAPSRWRRRQQQRSSPSSELLEELPSLWLQGGSDAPAQKDAQQDDSGQTGGQSELRAFAQLHHEAAGRLQAEAVVEGARLEERRQPRCSLQELEYKMGGWHSRPAPLPPHPTLSATNKIAARVSQACRHAHYASESTNDAVPSTRRQPTSHRRGKLLRC